MLELTSEIKFFCCINVVCVLQTSQLLDRFIIDTSYVHTRIFIHLVVVTKVLKPIALHLYPIQIKNFPKLVAS